MRLDEVAYFARVKTETLHPENIVHDESCDRYFYFIRTSRFHLKKHTHGRVPVACYVRVVHKVFVFISIIIIINNNVTSLVLADREH